MLYNCDYFKRNKLFYWVDELEGYDGGLLKMKCVVVVVVVEEVVVVVVVIVVVVVVIEVIISPYSCSCWRIVVCVSVVIVVGR